MWNNLIQQCATSLTLFYSVIEIDVVLVTILIVVDNYNSYRDLLFRHLMFRIAFNYYMNLLYGSIMRVALCRVQHHHYCSNTLLLCAITTKEILTGKRKSDGLWYNVQCTRVR